MRVQDIWKKGKIIMAFVLCLFVLSACKKENSPEQFLNPENPLVLTLWHYQGGAAGALFEQQIAEFNRTLGKEKGIIIDAQYKGNLSELAGAVYDAATKAVGSEPLPDIFSAYPEDIYRMRNVVETVDLEQYFSEEELSVYQEDFLENGRVDGVLRLLPIMKSTEAVYLNETDWEAFSEDTGLSKDSLSTWEGLNRAADLYYEWSGGHGFWGIDSAYNFFVMAAMQSGEKFIETEEGNSRFVCSEKLARIVWDNYLVPGITGRYIKSGQYAHIDIQSGNSLAAVSTTAGAFYLPVEVTRSLSDSYSIQYKALPYPYLENGKKYAPLRGMDMCIKKSAVEREYAASIFLKWLTEGEQNVTFAVTVGYLPVRKEALSENVLKAARERIDTELSDGIVNDALFRSLQTSQEYTLYNMPPYEKVNEMKDFLNNCLPGYIEKLSGLSKPGEEDFQIWFKTFLKDGNKALNAQELKERSRGEGEH